MARPQLLPDIYVPTFEMKVAGQTLPLPVTKSVLEISVTESLSLPSHFSFRVNDPQLSLINQKNGLLTEGKRVEIALGFVGNTRQMIVGEISALAPDFPNSGPATIAVEGFDLLHRLARGTTYRLFSGQKPEDGKPHKDIVSTILKEASLKASIDPALSASSPKVQDQVTNLAFLERLAQEDGYHLWLEGETVFFQSKPLELPNLTLEWGKTLMSFSPRLTTAGQIGTVEIRGWDPAQKQALSARVSRSGSANEALAQTGRQQISQGAGGASQRVIVDPGLTSAQEAKARAELFLYNQQQSLVTGRGLSVGQPQMRVGTILTLRGIGRFNHDYVVTSVTHSLGSAGYQTSFEVSQKP